MDKTKRIVNERITRRETVEGLYCLDSIEMTYFYH